jgi:hypothetical protein
MEGMRNEAVTTDSLLLNAPSLITFLTLKQLKRRKEMIKMTFFETLAIFFSDGTESIMRRG